MVSKDTKRRHRHNPIQSPIVNPPGIEISAMNSDQDDLRVTDYISELMETATLSDSTTQWNSLENNNKIGLEMMKIGIAQGVSNSSLKGLLKVNSRPSIHKLKKQLNIIGPLEAEIIECCINGCCLFENSLDQFCLDCKEPRFRADGAPVAVFTYLPLIPRLVTKLRNIRYRKQSAYAFNFVTSKESQNDNAAPSQLEDIYDGEIFRNLRNSGVIHNTLGDICLAIGLDGYSFQKKYTF